MAPHAPIQRSIAHAFDQAQRTSASHHKHSVALSSLLRRSLAADQEDGDGDQAFADAFLIALSRALPVKQDVAAADRTLAFVGTFVRYLRLRYGHVADRFAARILDWLLPGFQAKDKAVRLRCVMLAAELLRTGVVLGDQLQAQIESALIDRAGDVDVRIRTCAVTALCAVTTVEPLETAPQEHVAALLWSLSCDPSPHVRRIVVSNIPLDATTIDPVLERLRDTDWSVRRSVHLRLAAHASRLLPRQRAQVASLGLEDGQPLVRAAAGKLVLSWFDLLSATHKTTEPALDDQHGWRFIVERLSLFAPIASFHAATAKALKHVFLARPDIMRGLDLSGLFWEGLDLSHLLLARCAAEVAVETSDNFITLPSLTEMSEYIKEVTEESYGTKDTGREERDLALQLLLDTVMLMDLSDEVGRRKMFDVIRDIVSRPDTPIEVYPAFLDVFKLVAPTEGEFIRVLVEVMINLRDTSPNETSDQPSQEGHTDTTRSTQSQERSLRRPRKLRDMTAEEREQAITIDLRCLALCNAMLQRVDKHILQYSVLDGLLADLLLPAVKSSHKELQRSGKLGFALCCLLSFDVATSALPLFMCDISDSGETECDVQSVHIMFDLLLMHHSRLGEQIKQDAVQRLMQLLEATSDPDVRSAVIIGLCKLLFNDVLNDSRILSTLVLAFVSPPATANEESIQCLACFLPLYCGSSAIRRSQMASIFTETYCSVARAGSHLPDDETTVTPL